MQAMPVQQLLSNNSWQANTWIEKNFIKMKDIITDEGTILTDLEENINIKYDIRFKPLEYNSLVSSILKK